MAHEFVKLASFNVRGLGVQSCLKQKNLISDMKKYKIDICSLQETKTQQNIDKELDKYRIIIQLKVVINITGAVLLSHQSIKTAFINTGK